MKKFTKNFLLEGHGMLQVLRKIGLSMVVILFTMVAFSQEHQDTYHIYAGTADSCYQADNDYTVLVSFKDFVKIKEFGLDLKVSGTEIAYVGADILVSSLNSTTITEASGVISLDWSSSSAVSILPDNNVTPVFALHFKVNGFQHNYATTSDFLFESNLTWGAASFMQNDVGQNKILTSDQRTDGKITVTQGWQDVVVDSAAASCGGANAMATILSPLTGSYSFNGSSYTANNTAVVNSSASNFVNVKSGQCISYTKTFMVGSPVPVSFVADDGLAICEDQNGEIAVTITGGVAPFTVWVIPDDDDNLVEAAAIGGVTLTDAVWDRYKSVTSNRDFQYQDLPGTYYVAVNDANGCKDLEIKGELQSDDYDDDSGFFQEAVISQLNVQAWSVSDTIDNAQCFGYYDGRFGAEYSGASPWIASGSNVYSISVSGPGGFAKTASGDSIGYKDLHAGDYYISVTDSVGCVYLDTITITQPGEINFDMEHTDASCNMDNGNMWVDVTYVTRGTDTITDFTGWTWIYDDDADFSSPIDTLPVGTATGKVVPKGYYYIKVYDEVGCPKKYVNPENDNAVKILATELEVNITPNLCYGSLASASIDLVTGSGNHTISYGYEFMTSDSLSSFGGVAMSTDSSWFNGLPVDTLYKFMAYDSTIGCLYEDTVWIEGPDSLFVEIIDSLTLEPTCHGNNDGNVQIRVTGGTPWKTGDIDYYEYRFDSRPAERARMINTFAADTGTHVITVWDKNGCTTEIEITLSLTPNVIPDIDTVQLGCMGDQLFIHELYNVLADGSYTSNVYDTVSWIHEPVGQAQGEREPKWYISDMPYASKADIVANGIDLGHEPDTLTRGGDPKFGAGTYYIVAKDEWGCYSNVDTVDILNPIPLSFTAVAANGTCNQNFEGSITIAALNGKHNASDTLATKKSAQALERYQYVISQSFEILEQADWYNQVSWSDFYNDDPANDSIVEIEAAAGTYWVAVRSWCEVWNPALIDTVSVEVKSYEAIAIDASKIVLDSITCRSENNNGIIDASAAVTGGAGGYLYTLSDTAGVMDGRWAPNHTGVFDSLPGGTYNLFVTDSIECPGDNVDILVWYPELLLLDVDTAHVSCNGLHDGLIRYHITGGTAPYKESTNNIGEFESASQVPAERWYNVPKEDMAGGLYSSNDAVYDRRAKAGIYVIYIMDANNCLYTVDTVEVKEPAKITVSAFADVEPLCTTDQNGSFKYTVAGGWASKTDGYKYHVKVTAPELGSVAAYSLSAIVDYQDTLMLSNLAGRTYTFEVFEYDSTNVWNAPYTTFTGYFNNWNDSIKVELPFQNNADCGYTATHTLEAPDGITYERSFLDARCYNDTSGVIKLWDIAGGTKPYTVKLEGPEDYDRADSVVLLVSGTTNLTAYTWDNLIWGHYNIIITDANECQIFKESAEIENPDSLTLQVALVSDATCNDSTGVIKLTAGGGSGSYLYAVDTAWAPSSSSYFPLEDDDYLDNLGWQTSATFNVTAGTWIGFVKDVIEGDDRPACVQGWSTTRLGVPIDHHRVVVEQPAAVVVGEIGYTKPLCFGDANGTLIVDTIYGGSGPKFYVHVEGTDYTGATVDKWYFELDGGTDVLDGLKASYYYPGIANDTTTLVDADYYKVTAYSSLGCPSVVKKVALKQNHAFEITVKAKQDAFICWDDLAGLYDIIVVSGGEPFAGNDFKFRWSAVDANGVVKVDTTNYGFTDQFLGQAGYTYTVEALDANGCVATKDTLIIAPEPVTFAVKDISCYGDSMASARVMAYGTEGRTFKVRWTQILNPASSTTPIGDKAWSASFDGMVDLLDTFSYGNINEVEGHFIFQVMDTLGCTSEVDTITFVPVQNPLEVSVATVEGECTADATLTITGGIPPYAVTVNGDAVTMTTAAGVNQIVGNIVLQSGSNVIVVTDNNLRCSVTKTEVVTGTPVVTDVDVTTDLGETTAYVNAEAGVDTVLAEGVHTFTYEVGGCTRTLNVTVTGVAPELTIMAIQGEVAASPYVAKTVKTSGTVTAVATGGYYIQDASAAWSGIFVADATSTTIAVGSGVEITGVVSEEDGVTTITPAVDGVTLLTTADAITPVLVAAPADAAAEMYESVLVTVAGARAEAVDADGEWTIYTEATSTAVVNDLMFAYTPVAGNFYDVTGVVNGAADAYTVEPRDAADVVDLTATSNGPEVGSVEFKVYPNPFNNHINIENAHMLTRVIVSNIAGQRIIDVKYPEREIRTTGLASGVYMVTMFTEDGIAKTERIVKR